ncbi:hypothetical protein KBX18_09450 [Corynebacterium sp. CCUG 69979]|uniref:hypothetical protein n=1 Tax=Corynebacterium sp. CCUG 69979 TaxID=2823890 RepID=UPI00210B9835|nr:hypothetical protein [Corynebacterium sp. CCUG 69979]MCQ4625769.1 hypothetical protein [Corynebacterium sp. CCUG 69979]
MFTTANIATAIFVLAALGIVRKQVQANGLFAGLIFSVMPIIGLLVAFAIIFLFGTALSLAANEFADQEEKPNVDQGTFYDNPGDALNSQQPMGGASTP